MVGGDQSSNTWNDLTSSLGESASEALPKGSCAHVAWLKHTLKHIIINAWRSTSKQQEIPKSWSWRNGGFSPLWFEPRSIWHYLFEEVHEAWSEAPGFVAVTLQGADGHLSGPLGRDSHHEDGIIHQGSVRLWGRQRKRKMLLVFSFILTLHVNFML